MFCQCFWYKMCFRFAKITISVLHNYKSNPLSADAFYHLKMHQVCRLGSAPDPTGRSLQRSPDPQ